MATLSDTGLPLTPFGMPKDWIPHIPTPPAATPPKETPPKETAPVTPPWQPQPEQSLAYLRNPASRSTDYGPMIWDPTTGRWIQISANPTPWDPNQLSKGVIIGSSDPNSPNYITPERAAQMGLTREGINYSWNPTSEELAQHQNYWASPEGKAMLGQYSQTGGGFAGSPTGGAPAAGYNMYNPNTGAVSPYSGAYPGQGGLNAAGNPISGTTPAATDPAAAAAAAGIPGTGTGGQFNYPMNPLADAASQPNIMAQNSLLAMMQQDPYLSGLLQPYLNQAYSAIGRSGMPTSSYTDQMLANIIAPMYLANQQNVLGGYGNLTNQLAQLAATAQEPYQTALNYILSF